jgi:hypothetical protein
MCRKEISKQAMSFLCRFFQQSFGRDHPMTLDTHIEKIMCLFDLFEYSNAESCIREVLSICEGFSTIHPSLLRETRYLLSLALYKQSSYAAAGEVLAKILHQADFAPLKGCDVSLNSLQLHAFVLERQGQLISAESELRDVVWFCFESLGPHDARSLSHLAHLREFLERRGRMDEAGRIFTAIDVIAPSEPEEKD